MNYFFYESENSSVHNLFNTLGAFKSLNESQLPWYANSMALLCVIYHQTDIFVVPIGNERLWVTTKDLEKIDFKV